MKTIFPWKKFKKFWKFGTFEICKVKNALIATKKDDRLKKNWMKIEQKDAETIPHILMNRYTSTQFIRVIKQSMHMKNHMQYSFIAIWKIHWNPANSFKHNCKNFSCLPNCLLIYPNFSLKKKKSKALIKVWIRSSSGNQNLNTND